MKIVVIGGSGLIGKKLVSRLRDKGHEVIAASPSSGVNTLTGEGLAEVLTETEVVVDVANSPSFADAPVMEFFETAARHLLPAEIAAGVKHHVALSVVGADLMTGSGYMRAKVVQENAIRASGVPYTILRATQFFEFIGSIADGSMKDGKVHVSPVLMQPVAADNVAAVLGEIAIAQPVNAIVELAGPEAVGIDVIVRRLLSAKKDARKVVTDPSVGYFGADADDRTLVPEGVPRIGATSFAEWLNQ